jgi:Fe-S-cluster containining protein
MRFACQSGCTRCCNTRGFVYITENDLIRIAKYLGLPAKTFEERYVIRYRRILRLRKPRHSQCHFLTETGCSVHAVKPVQCRTYPFWPELVENRRAWNNEAARCPGIHKGDLIQIGTACEIAGEMKKAYPSLYTKTKTPLTEP